MSEALARRESSELQRVEQIDMGENSSGILTIIDRHLEKGGDIAGIDSLVTLFERMKAIDNKQKFNDAFSDMQKAMPTVPRNGKGRTGNRYALRDDIVRILRPHLATFGFSFSFKYENVSQGWLLVTFILRHKAGHEETTPVPMPIEAAGEKIRTPTQEIGNSATYGERKSMAAGLGLDAGEVDNDGEREPITEAQAINLQGKLAEGGYAVAAFLKWIQTRCGGHVDALAKIPAIAYDGIINELNRRIAEKAKGAQK